MSRPRKGAVEARQGARLELSKPVIAFFTNYSFKLPGNDVFHCNCAVVFRAASLNSLDVTANSDVLLPGDAWR